MCGDKNCGIPADAFSSMIPFHYIDYYRNRRHWRNCGQETYDYLTSVHTPSLFFDYQIRNLTLSRINLDIRERNFINRLQIDPSTNRLYTPLTNA